MGFPSLSLFFPAHRVGGPSSYPHVNKWKLRSEETSIGGSNSQYTELLCLISVLMCGVSPPPLTLRRPVVTPESFTPPAA